MIILNFTDPLRRSTTPRIKGVYVIDFGKKVYIGGSTHVLKRLNHHRSLIRNKTHRYFKEINGFNESKAIFRIYPMDNFYETEKLITKTYMSLGIALNECIGNETSDSQKAKISKKLKGRKATSGRKGIPHTAETKLKISRALMGKKLSKEHIEKLKISSKGNTNKRDYSNKKKQKNESKKY